MNKLTKIVATSFLALSLTSTVSLAETIDMEKHVNEARDKKEYLYVDGEDKTDCINEAREKKEYLYVDGEDKTDCINEARDKKEYLYVDGEDMSNIIKEVRGENEYLKGMILVGFDTGVIEEQANDFLESYDPKDEIEMQIYRPRLGLAEVTVPDGKEKEYAEFFDKMKEDTIIRYAELNYMRYIQ